MFDFQRLMHGDRQFNHVCREWNAVDDGSGAGFIGPEGENGALPGDFIIAFLELFQGVIQLPPILIAQGDCRARS